MARLFSPGKIKQLSLKNRVVALPVFTGYALPDGRVSPLMLGHYGRLASSGAGMVVVPNVAVTQRGRTSERSLFLDHDRHIPELRRLADVIKKQGALASIQLNHAGRYAVSGPPLLPSPMGPDEILSNVSVLKSFMEGFSFYHRFGLTAHLAKMTAGWTLGMTDDQISRIIRQFGDAAHRAVQAGFEMIELHGATGYLIAQFLSPATNRREPPWGGSAEHRMGFSLEIIREIKARVPAHIPLGFRLILDEISENGITRDQALDLAQALESAGIDYLSATIGTYQTMFLPEVAKQLARPGYLTDLTRDLKARVSVPVVISGRIISPALAEKILKQGAADLIGLGRPLLADSRWIAKARRRERIVGCKNCHTCFREVALGQSILCERWPRAVQDRIRLENSFTSRNGYRTLIVISSLSDLETVKFHAENRAPIHKGILDRHLFIDTGDEVFLKAAQKYAQWSERFYSKRLNRPRVENIFLRDVRDPVGAVLSQLRAQFGIVCLFHNGEAPWKAEILRKIPAHVVAFRGGNHPNIKKVLVPCDLSAVTHMQIRVARHLFHGRRDSEFDFVHVSQDPEWAAAKWKRITAYYPHKNLDRLTVIRPEVHETTADILVQKIAHQRYGCLVMGRRGGLARLRRRIFGSVSQRLLDEFPDRTFGIIG